MVIKMTAESAMSKTVFEPPKKAEDWAKCIHSIIKSMHQGLSILYDGIEELSDAATAVSTEESNEEFKGAPSVAHSFTESCQNLRTLLSTPTKGLVKLPLTALIDVLARTLKVSPADIKTRPSLSELSELLPSLHQSAFRVLAQLIVSCGSLVLPKSNIIIDVTLHSLSGCKHSKHEAKCNTRACAYQVLGLLVQRFGWGKHLKSLSQLIVQDIMSDVQLQECPKMISAAAAADQEAFVKSAVSRQEIETIAQRKGKKKKKGKKHKGDSYSDLPTPGADGKDALLDAQLFNVAATREALQLSGLILERAEFSQVETLIRCVLDTTKTLQREDLPRGSPYKAAESRKDLYDTVFACAAVRLGNNSSRKYTVSHFRASNLALSLLQAAANSDASFAVRRACSQSLTILKNISSINPPIVRKIQPDETAQTDMRDVTEVEKEADRLSEENKGLWQQLVDAQVTAESQRRELEALRQAVKEQSTERPLGASLSLPTTNEDSSGQDQEEESSLAENHHPEGGVDQPDVPDYNKQTLAVPSDEGSGPPSSAHVDSNKKSSAEEKTSSPKKAIKKGKKRAPDDELDDTKKQKKSKDSFESSAEVKSSLIIDSEDQVSDITEDVEAMISDFVDAAPDAV